MRQFTLIYPSSYPNSADSDASHETTFNCVPIGALCIASYLESFGYGVKFIDARIYEKKKSWDLIDESLKDSFAVGISSVTGQLGHALQIADRIKQNYPNLPVIFGGIHPTLFPEQTIEDKSVDYVIQGEGEFALGKLLRFLGGEEIKLSQIEGLAYGDKSTIYVNDPADPIDVNLLPDPNYNLLDIEKYIDREIHFYTQSERVRAIDIYTSRGCPYRCSFCTNTVRAFKKWRPLNKDRILRTVEKLVKQHDLNHVKFSDDYFFGNKTYSKELVTGIKKLNLNFKWLGNIRVDCLARNILDDETFDLLRSSGCLILNVGIESGSQRILDTLKKDITPEQAIDFFKKCYEYEIVPLATFMIGIPGEEMSDVKSTVTLMDKLFEVNPNALLGAPGVFRPYPGTELYQGCKSYGFKEPETLRRWAGYDFGDLTSNLFISAKDLPWVKNHSLVSDIGHYIFWYFDYLYNGKKAGFPLERRILGYLAKHRVRRNFWRFRIEAFLARLRSKLKSRRHVNAETR